MIAMLPSTLPRAQIGGKARGLSDLMAWGFHVPPAFVLRADAPATLDPDACAALCAAAHALGDGPWAVRSSGVEEDGAQHSFAGMHETVLGVEGDAALLDAVARCRASGASERARHYLQQVTQGSAARAHATPAEIAVVVQRQLAPACAGVAFSRDPVQGGDGLVIEAVHGLGEALVSGHATPTRARVGSDGALLSLKAGDGMAPCIDAAIAIQLAHIVRAVEQRAGVAVDVEWALEGERVWLLQWRPITTPAVQHRADARRVVWTNTNAAELLPHVAKPMVEDMVLRAVDDLLAPMLRPFGLSLATLGVIAQVQGRIYFELNAILGWARGLPGGRTLDSAGLVAALGGDVERLSAAVAMLRPADIAIARLPLWRTITGPLRLLWGLLRHENGDGAAAFAAARDANAAFRAVRLGTLDDAALLAHLQGLLTQGFGPHAGLLPAAWGMLGFAAMQALSARWLGDAAGALPKRWLQGMGGLDSAAAGTALAALAEFARTCGLVDALDAQWDVLRVRLDARADGRAFRERFDAFMAEHGHHARGEVDVSIPRWRDEPDYVLRLVRAAARAPLRPMPKDADRRRAFADDTATLGAFRRAVFRGLLRRTERGVATRENLKSEAVRRLALIRETTLEVAGRARARGALANIDDVWYLRFAELPALFAAGVPAQTIAERRTQVEAWSRAAPPSVVVAGFDLAPGTPAIDTLQLTGVAASPGVAEGVARVVLHADADTVLDPGEILIAPHTDPGWTPYFVQAAAVVTDFGGMLSHGAIVAREYGLPCVCNVAGATTRIRSGQRVRVDGTHGQVTLL